MKDHAKAYIGKFLPVAWIFLRCYFIKQKKIESYFFLFRPTWTHENCFSNPIISKTTHHTTNIKIYSERAKLALYKNVLTLFEIIICCPNK